MKITKGNREFTVELDGSRIIVREGEESVYGYESDNVIRFPKPNPNITNNGTALEGLSITPEQSEEINESRNNFLEQKREKEEARRGVPNKIRFYGNANFQATVTTKNVKFSFIDTLNSIGFDWLRKNSEIVDRTDNGYVVYEIATSIVLAHVAGREDRTAEQNEATEGKVAYSECWECGRVRISGWFKSGRLERIPRECLNKVKAAFNPIDGVKVYTINPEDCGC